MVNLDGTTQNCTEVGAPSNQVFTESKSRGVR